MSVCRHQLKCDHPPEALSVRVVSREGDGQFLGYDCECGAMLFDGEQTLEALDAVTKW